MRNFYFALLCLASAFAFTGCGDQGEIFIYETTSQPSVTIGQVGNSGYHDVTMRFTVSDNGAGFTYGIGTPDDRAAFENGTLATIRRVEEGGMKEIVIDGLTHMTDYTVFARAFDSGGNTGPVAQAVVATTENVLITHPLQVGVQYVTSSAVAFTVDPANNYYKFEYALGFTGDRAAFDAGTLPAMVSQEQNVRYVISYFEIEPATDYILYIRAYDRQDKMTETVEVPFSTYADGTVPGVSMAITRQDFYSGTYSFEPNQATGEYGVLVCEKGAYDGLFYSKYSYNGDVFTRMLDYMASPSWSNPLKLGDGTTVEADLITAGMELDAGLEAWIFLYDKDGEPFGVENLSFTTPSFDNTAGVAEVNSFEFTSISAWYNPFTFSVNDNTMMTFVGVWDDPDEFEAALAASDNDRMCELNFEKSYNAFSSSYTFFYGNTSYSSSVGANTGKYYVGLTPVNANGPFGRGWGEFYYIELIVP